MFRWRIWVFALLTVMTYSLFCFCASAAEDEQSQIWDMMGDIADEAEQNGSGELGELWREDADLTGKTLTELLQPKRVLEEIFESVSIALPDAASMLCVMAGLCLLSAVCRRMCEGMGSGALCTGAEFVSQAAVICAMLTLQTGQFDMIKRFFTSLTSLMGSMIPVTGIVWAMGGNVTTASVGTATLYAMLSVTQRVCATTVLPVCYVTGVSAVCTGLCGSDGFCGFSRAVRRVYNFVIGLMMTVLVFALGAQTTIAVSADTAAARGAKLLTGTVIPVVGGAVGDTLRTVAGSVQYIKSVVGIGGILIALTVTLPTLVSLVLYRAVLVLSSGFADMLGCRREGQLLSELGNIYGCLLGAVAICSVAFVIALGIFVRCTVAAA